MRRQNLLYLTMLLGSLVFMGANGGGCGASVETLSDGTSAITAAATPQTLTVTHWYSNATHGAAGDFALEMLSDGSFIEARACALKIIATMSAPIDPKTIVPSSVIIEGQTTGNSAVDLSSQVISTSTSADNTQVYISFSAGLPDVASYRLRLVGILDANGNQLVGKKQDIVFSELQGDVNQSGRVDAGDVSLVRARSGTLPIASDTFSILSDLNCNGVINSTDISMAQARTLDSLSGISAPNY